MRSAESAGGKRTASGLALAFLDDDIVTQYKISLTPFACSASRPLNSSNKASLGQCLGQEGETCP
jgi:hypothetical protein